MKIHNYGISLGDGDALGERHTEIVFLSSNERLGRWLLVRGVKEEVEIRITKGGRIRISRPAPRTNISIDR